MKLYCQLIVFLLLPLVATAGDRLDANRLNEIVALEHEDRLDDASLRIYPKAREYELNITSTLADGESGTGKIVASEKWVEGRFIVSEVQPAGPETRFFMIVEYDRDSKRYRKYILMAAKLVGYQEGVRIADTRSVAWIDLTTSKFDSGMDNLSTETHTDTSTTWYAITYQKGVPTRTEVGVAKVTKS